MTVTLVFAALQKSAVNTPISTLKVFKYTNTSAFGSVCNIIAIYLTPATAAGAQWTERRTQAN